MMRYIPLFRRDFGIATPTPVRCADHLSPRRGERKGAKAGEFALFLSPVDRGRGGPRSGPEWGSAIHINKGEHS